MNWNPFKRRRRQEHDIIRRDRCLMLLDEWQSSPGLVKMAQSHLNHPEVRLMLDVVHNAITWRNELPLDAPPHARVALQSRSEGYSQCLANLEALGKFDPKAELGEETFGATDLPQEKEEG